MGHLRRALLALLCCCTVGWRPLVAQNSAWVALDDPALPLFEHLVARGSVADPSPLIRPFRRADAIRVLRQARGDAVLVTSLLQRWAPGDSAWRVQVRIGGEVATSASRDLLHPDGLGGRWIYADLLAQAELGSLALVTRSAIDMRASQDPDWPGERGKPDLICCRWRYPEAWLSWQSGALSLSYGRIGRNWGPVGIAGTALSEVAYPRDEIGLEINTHSFQLRSSFTQLEDARDPADQVIHRYHTVTHLALQLRKNLQLSGWQSVILQGRDRQLEGPFRNPLLLLPLANQIGMGDQGNNVMVGAQASWRLGSTTLQGEVVMDDLIQQNRDRFPDRYAMTFSFTTPASAGTALRLLYSRASSLAFRTSNPLENFTERGVGLGRARGDNDYLVLSLTRPISPGLLAGVELAALRQGEGRLTDPVDAVLPLRGIFLGTVERTLRVAGHAAGQAGPVQMQAELGINRLSNAGHVHGVEKTVVAGRVGVLLALQRRGRIGK